jgi:hypothetical protein
MSVGRLELLDIPGRWGRIGVDAFGRGRIDMSRPYSSQPVAYRGRRRPAGDRTGDHR